MAKSLKITLVKNRAKPTSENVEYRASLYRPHLLNSSLYLVKKCIVSSTAIPMAMEAFSISATSKGILNRPIIPREKITGIKFGIMLINPIFNDLKRKIIIIDMTIKANPNPFI